MGLGLPKAVTFVATEREKEYIQKLSVQKRNLQEEWKEMGWRGHHGSGPRTRNAKKTLQNRWRNISDEMRGMRLILRKRYSESFSNGLFINHRKFCPAYTKKGLYGVSWSAGVRKGELLVWIERDELNRNWFLTKDNRVISIFGASLDAIRKLKNMEDDHNGEINIK